jgi:hypothetical protein
MPEQNEFAGTIVRSLRERARACHCATTVIKPIALNMPTRRLIHVNYQLLIFKPYFLIEFGRFFYIA